MAGEDLVHISHRHAAVKHALGIDQHIGTQLAGAARVFPIDVAMLAADDAAPGNCVRSLKIVTRLLSLQPSSNIRKKLSI